MFEKERLDYREGGGWRIVWKEADEIHEICRIPKYYINDEGIADYLIEVMSTNRKYKINNGLFEL